MQNESDKIKKTTSKKIEFETLIAKIRKIQTGGEIELLKFNPEIPVPPRTLDGHEYGQLAIKIGIISDNDIKHWLASINKMPEDNTKAKIAEHLVALHLVARNTKVNPEELHIILNNIKIVRATPESDYSEADVSEIDHMVVIINGGKYIPIQIVETKSGRDGDEQKKLKQQLHSKVEALKAVKREGYLIKDQHEDLTNKFDLDVLEQLNDVELLTAGVYSSNDIQLLPNDIDGIYDYLCLFQELQQVSQS